MKTALMSLVTLAALGLGFCAAQEEIPNLKYLLCTEDTLHFRGEAALTNGQVEITLPGYFESSTRTDGRVIQITCREGWSPLYATPIGQGRFTVRTTESGSQTQAFWWQVMAPRKN